jgi:hypothetical protein
VEIAAAQSDFSKSSMFRLLTLMSRQMVVEINGGAKSIPVIVFPDGTHMTEPSDNDLKAKLVALGVVTA